MMRLHDSNVTELLAIARKAGNATLTLYNKDYKIDQKLDESPLTEADLASHNIIVSALSALTPNIPILSEESADIEWQTRSQWSEYWLIDPLDGTKEFIKKNGEYTINIALIQEGKPVFGVVFAPVLNTFFFGGKETGSFKIDEKGQRSPIKVSNRSSGDLTIVGSRSHQSDAIKDYLTKYKNYELVAMGSSLKFCVVAEGQADLYPRLGPTSEWDTAAAQAVLEGAGGEVVLLDSNTPLTYNQKDSLLNPFFEARGWV